MVCLVVGKFCEDVGRTRMIGKKVPLKEAKSLTRERFNLNGIGDDPLEIDGVLGAFI